MIELDKKIKKKIAFYYLSDAIGLFFSFFFWFIIQRTALYKTMNKKREYCILLFKIYKGTLIMFFFLKIVYTTA